MTSRSALDALGRRPPAFLRSAWPWRSLAYLALSAVLGLVVVLGVLVGAVSDSVAIAVAVGVFAVALCTPLVAGFERWRLRLVDLVPLPEHRADRRRDVMLALVSTLVLWWIDLMMLGLAIGGPAVLILSPVLQPPEADAAPWLMSAAGLLLLPVAAYTLTAWAGARGAMARALIVSQDTELDEIVRSRARLVDAFETERRRIERDLHDGAQQRLVALSMTLGLARLDVPEGTKLAEQLDRAHSEAKRALTDLRELIRGIHPQVLTDRGLAAAARDVAGRSPVPVEVDLELEARLPAAVEVAAYYAVSEALANVAKHSGATRAWVSGQVVGGALLLEVRDDGVGGADVSGGTGLAGLADRLAVVDGRLSVSSPRGGPTLLRVEIPCV